MAYEHNHHFHDIKSMSITRVFWVVFLNFLISVTELIGGLISRSLALVSDSIHNFSDTLSIALTYFALKISKRQTDYKMTFGYKRAQIIVAFINSFLLLLISAFLIFEAFKRFSHPLKIQSDLMIIIAVIGLFANLLSVLIIKKYSHSDINIRSSYLHLLADTLSSVAVVVGGVSIKLWNLIWLDPLLTLLIASYIIKETWKIFKKSVTILMEGSADLDYEEIKKDIENLDNIINIHHIHSWLGDEKTVYFEAHIIIKNILISQTKPLLEKINKLLKRKYGITHITIQFESENADCKKHIISQFK